MSHIKSFSAIRDGVELFSVQKQLFTRVIMWGGDKETKDGVEYWARFEPQTQVKGLGFCIPPSGMTSKGINRTIDWIIQTASLNDKECGAE
jgi:hypothetical protein